MVGVPWARISDEQFERQLNESYGLRNLKPEWVSAQRAQRTQQTSRQNSFVRLICDTEIREVSNGSLPWRIQDAHGVRLGVKVLVQIDEVTNIGASDPKAPSPRLLQFAFTDGATSLIGIELDTSKSSFSPNTVSGTKVTLLPTVLLRRGRVFLTYDDYELVGFPHRHARASVSGPAIQVPRHTRTKLFTCSNVGGASGDPSLNAPASSIVNVGGIAAITEESSDGGDVEGLWGENPAVRSRYPALMRQRAPGSPPVRSSVAEQRNAYAQRSSIEPGRLSCSIDVETSKANARDVKRRRDRFMAGVRGSNVTEKRAIPVNQQPSIGRIASFIPMDVDADLTVVQKTQKLSEMPSSSEVIEVSNPKQPKQAIEPERMDTVHENSPQIARLQDLIDSRHHVTSRPQICRLYAMKMGKKTDYQLTRSSPDVSTVVDDGTAARIVSVSDNLLDNLRISCAPQSVTVSQRTGQGIRRFLRSICGFVKMEFRDNILVATTSVSEPLTFSMLSVYLDDVNARFSRYLAS